MLEIFWRRGKISNKRPWLGIMWGAHFGSHVYQWLSPGSWLPLRVKDVRLRTFCCCCRTELVFATRHYCYQCCWPWAGCFQVWLCFSSPIICWYLCPEAALKVCRIREWRDAGSSLSPSFTDATCPMIPVVILMLGKISWHRQVNHLPQAPFAPSLCSLRSFSRWYEFEWVVESNSLRWWLSTGMSVGNLVLGLQACSWWAEQDGRSEASNARRWSMQGWARQIKGQIFCFVLFCLIFFCTLKITNTIT
jgi:hypothetical protein